MTATVYRCYDAQGVLLYVGCSENVEARLRSHWSKAHWAYRAVDITTQEYPSLEAARAAEKHAIRTEDPLCNVMSRSQDRTGWTRQHYVDFIAARRSSMGSDIVRRNVQRMTAEMDERYPVAAVA